VESHITTRITVDPRVRWGTPCIRDTGVSVRQVVALAIVADSDEEVLEAFPQLDQPDLDAAVAWYTRHGDEGLSPAPPDPGADHPRIVVDPRVQGGYPTVRGTRIPVDTIVGLWAEGATVEEILADLPTLSPDDVLDAVGYAADADAQR
jgi:uncharacterized protein (DUF433 family)